MERLQARQQPRGDLKLVLGGASLYESGAEEMLAFQHASAHGGAFVFSRLWCKGGVGGVVRGWVETYLYVWRAIVRP